MPSGLLAHGGGDGDLGGVTASAASCAVVGLPWAGEDSKPGGVRGRKGGLRGAEGDPREDEEGEELWKPSE